jgi:hypothetical protein
MPRRFPFAGSFCGGLTWRVSRALKSLDLAGDLDCVIAESLQQPGDCRPMTLGLPAHVQQQTATMATAPSWPLWQGHP